MADIMRRGFLKGMAGIPALNPSQLLTNFLKSTAANLEKTTTGTIDLNNIHIDDLIYGIAAHDLKITMQNGVKGILFYRTEDWQLDDHRRDDYGYNIPVFVPIPDVAQHLVKYFSEDNKNLLDWFAEDYVHYINKNLQIGNKGFMDALIESAVKRIGPQNMLKLSVDYHWDMGSGENAIYTLLQRSPTFKDYFGAFNVNDGNGIKSRAEELLNTKLSSEYHDDDNDDDEISNDSYNNTEDDPEWYHNNSDPFTHTKERFHESKKAIHYHTKAYKTLCEGIR